jgi:TolB protein
MRAMSRIALFLFFTFSTLLYAERIYIKIGEPEFKKPMLAFSIKCAIDNCSDVKEIEDVFKSDILFSNVFVLLSKDMYPSDDKRVDIGAWKVSGAEYVLFMDVQKRSIDAKLIALRTGEEVFSENFKNEDAVIDTTHSISNQVYYRLTGQKGIFKTKIAFIGRKGKESYKNLFIMDYDGRRIEQRTSYKTIAVSPAWSPDGRYIAYTRYAPTRYSGKGKLVNPNLYLYDVKREREKVISEFQGQNSGAAWSSDGKYIAYTSSKDGNPDIYLYNMDNGAITSLIKNSGVNVEPSFSPDGKSLVFSSSRTGNPELYRYEMDTQKQTRLTFSRYYNSSPSWSPASDKIAFAGLDNPFGKRSFFDVFLVSPSGDNIERLTIDSGNNEDPSWSPDGRHLIYSSTRNGGSDIYFINNDGTGERKLTSGILCYSPDWSPSSK